MDAQRVKKLNQVLNGEGGGEKETPNETPKPPKKEEPEHPTETEADFLRVNALSW